MRPAPSDPPEVHSVLWDGFNGRIGYDVGANCGQSLSEMIQRFGIVHAFEPATECQPYLARWRPSTVHIHRLAVSDHDGEVELSAVPSKIETGQLVTADLRGMEWTDEAEISPLRSVSCSRLDTLAQKLGAPDFLKVDVEGHELKVLLGAVNLLASTRPRWLIEIHSPELGSQCADILDTAGYQLEVVRHPHYEERSPFWFQHYWIRAFPG